MLLLAMKVTPSFSSILPPGFIEEELATGLDPTDMAIANDGRIFIAQKNGVVVLWRDGKLLDLPFIELDVDNTNERGLQSIELDPEFDTNGYIYFFYSVPNININRVSRHTANGDRAVPNSEVVLYEMDATIASVHNGGGMAFHPDGTLYFTAGDGSATWRSQWDDQTHGKIMRINKDGSIPADNPNQTGNKYAAVVAKGLRNPFNLTINEDGRTFINDVGGDKFEEINELEFGVNFGWPILEGKRMGQNVPSNYKDPIYAYDHDIGCAIVGGVFCPQDNMHFPEEYRGKYFFSDYCKGYIKVLDPATGMEIETFATEADRPLRLAFDQSGRMYYFERAGLGGGGVNDNTMSSNGRLLRVSYSGNGIPVISRDPRDILVSEGETATFSIAANGSNPLAYEWRVNDVPVSGADSSKLVLSNTSLAQNGSVITCIISNTEGADTSGMAILSVTDNQRPVPTIKLTSDSLYSAGQSIVVVGSAMDPEDGMLSSSAFTWWIDFHHDLHTHPALGGTTGVDEVDFAVPSVGEIDDNVWFRVYLNVIDGGGLAQTTFLDVYPKKLDFIVRSNPSGLEVNVDGTTVITPDTFRSVAGIEHTCVPLLFQTDDDNAYIFNQWSNGQNNASFVFEANLDGQVIEADFDAYPLGKGDGLRGEYYNFFNKEPIFGGVPAISRVDSIIDFEWDTNPDTNLLKKDSFMVRWTGAIEPILDGYYSFGVSGRHGMRFYLDDELLVDEWQVNPLTFWQTDSVELQAGKKYPVRMEVYKVGGSLVGRLLWEHSKMSMRLIPQSQLYSTAPSSTNEDSALITSLWPNPTQDVVNIRTESQTPVKIRVDIFNIDGQHFYEKDYDLNSGRQFVTIGFHDFPAGVYFMQFLVDGEVVRKEKIVRLSESR